MGNHKMKMGNHKLNLRTKGCGKPFSTLVHLIGQLTVSVTSPRLITYLLTFLVRRTRTDICLLAHVTSVPVFLTRGVRRQVINHGLLTDTVSWGMRCTRSDRDTEAFCFQFKLVISNFHFTVPCLNVIFYFRLDELATTRFIPGEPFTAFSSLDESKYQCMILKVRTWFFFKHPGIRYPLETLFTCNDSIAFSALKALGMRGTSLKINF